MKPELKRNLKHAVVDLEFVDNEIGSEAVEEVISYCEELEAKLITQDEKFKVNVTFNEELVFERFKEFLKSANLTYDFTYNPKGDFWNVFIYGKGEIMRKAVNSTISVFIDIEKYFKEEEKRGERKWW